MGNVQQRTKRKKRKEGEDKVLDRYTKAFVYDEPFTWDGKNTEGMTRRQKRLVKKRLKKRAKLHPPPPMVKERAIPAEREVIPVPNQDDQSEDEKLEKIPKSSELNERVEKALERTNKLEKALTVIPRQRLLFQPLLMESKQKQMLFINPGDESIQMAHYAIVQNTELPKWAYRFQDILSADSDTLYFQVHGRALPFAWKEDKRAAVKKLYFHPKKPSTIQPITDALREKFCNISKTNVTHILRSLETYQRNFGRRRPPKVLGRMNLSQPGILACDMFFPSKTLGWRKMNCLAIMDTWSRFVRCYALPRKDLKSQEAAFTLFLNEFTALGHLPRRMLADKGSDLKGARATMEKYRQAKDKHAALVLHSATGTPINIIEAMNAQIQRRMQIFRTAGLTDDPSVLLEDVCDQINNQRRPDRGNLTPLQLLSLTPGERKQVNEVYKDRTQIPEVIGLRPVYVGDFVRILKMTRKEQEQNKTKGFAPKWSKHVYRVRKKLPIAKNKEHFRYYLKHVGDFYYRHEILKIPKTLDKKVPKGYVTHKEKVVAPDENWSDLTDYGTD